MHAILQQPTQHKHTQVDELAKEVDFIIRNREARCCFFGGFSSITRRAPESGDERRVIAVRARSVTKSRRLY